MREHLRKEVMKMLSFGEFGIGFVAYIMYSMFGEDKNKF